MKTNDDDTFGSTDRDKMTQDDQNSRAVNKGDLVSKDQGFERVRVHVDPDVLARLREGGKGWQTRANAALRVALGLDKG